MWSASSGNKSDVERLSGRLVHVLGVGDDPSSIAILVAASAVADLIPLFRPSTRARAE
jgi:hypothetical protein